MTATVITGLLPILVFFWPAVHRQVRVRRWVARFGGRATVTALTLLAAELEDERWPRAAARWVGRLLVESPAITINEAVLAAAAVHGCES